MNPNRLGEQRSLLTYLRAYADGQVSREQMIDDVSAWPLDDGDLTGGDPHDYVPDLGDNSVAVLSAAVTVFGWISEEDYREIARRRAAHAPTNGREP